MERRRCRTPRLLARRYCVYTASPSPSLTSVHPCSYVDGEEGRKKSNGNNNNNGGEGARKVLNK